MRSLCRLGPLFATSALFVFGCEKPASHGADSAKGAPSSRARVAAAASAPATTQASVAPAASLAQAPSASAAAAPVASVESTLEPPLHDADGKPLPQTDERPSVDSPAFKRRIELLAQAIVQDNAASARSAFFPVVAYEQVKAVAKPARDWEQRLLRAFERNVHEYHRALGPEPTSAKFLGISVKESAARFMKPGSEGNLLGYYRVLRSRLAFERGDGKRLELELTSMISWRGEWYVVHLHGFE